MRCQFCGWDNPEGRTKCEKCNKPLSNGSNHNAAEPSINMPVSARGGKSGRPTQYWDSRQEVTLILKPRCLNQVQLVIR